MYIILPPPPLLPQTHIHTTPLDMANVMVNIEGACEGESSTDTQLSDKTDGITSAYSTGDISRPLSIFSGELTMKAKPCLQC